MLPRKNSTLLSTSILIISMICLGIIIISIWGVREGWFDIRSAFTTIGYAALAGIPILVVALIIIYLSRGNICSQVKSGLAVILMLIPVIGHYGNQPKNQTPGIPLNDISTDTANPPLFNAVIALRPAKSNTVEYPGDKAAARQKELFPDITSIESSLSAENSFQLALDIAKSMGWNIVAQDMNAGLIEAVESTPVFSFEDDIVIRVLPINSGSIIDIRSRSRVGRSDRGKNAERIREFINRF